MLGTSAVVARETRDRLVTELTDAALAVARMHETNGASVDLEIELWHALGGAVRDRAKRELLDEASHHWEDRMADLTDAAYRVLLRYGFHDFFIDLQIDLRKAFRHVIRQQRFLPTSNRLSGILAIR